MAALALCSSMTRSTSLTFAPAARHTPTTSSAGHRRPEYSTAPPGKIFLASCYLVVVDNSLTRFGGLIDDRERRRLVKSGRESYPNMAAVPDGPHKFDPNFTQSVINATGPNASPRIRRLASSLIQHLHDFVRENEVTMEEFMAGIEALNESGRMSTEKRNETLLVCDMIGLESLVDEITYKLASSADEPTATAILGPFYRSGAPILPNGSCIVSPSMNEQGDRTLVHGIVTDMATGQPIQGAVVDVWHAGPNGLYDLQDEAQPDMNLRGRFTTGKDGKYNFYCLRPAPYPVPDDGPGGKLLKVLDRHPWRPAHIHFLLTAPSYRPIITQIFDRKSKYLTDDSAFAVKQSLIVDFAPLKGDPKADFELPYDFRLVSYKDAETLRAS